MRPQGFGIDFLPEVAVMVPSKKRGSYQGSGFSPAILNTNLTCTRRSGATGIGVLNLKQQSWRGTLIFSIVYGRAEAAALIRISSKTVDPRNAIFAPKQNAPDSI